MTLLFVCTGNICRSALAERLAARWLGDDAPVASAGTHAVQGRLMHPLSAAVLERHGGTAEHFRSRPLTPGLLADASLVLAMTDEHLDAVLRMSPRSLHSTFTLREAAALLDDNEHIPVVGSGLADPAAVLAQHLAEARAMRGRRSAYARDIEDPMGRSSSTHARVGGEVAVAVRTVTDALLGGPQSEALTIRMRRLPPVPAYG
jgi:protein-tyrosine-phosphatase